MSVANNFPDISLSPIASESNNDDNSFSLHFPSSLETPLSQVKRNRYAARVADVQRVERTLGTRQISDYDVPNTDAAETSTRVDVIESESMSLRSTQPPPGETQELSRGHNNEGQRLPSEEVSELFRLDTVTDELASALRGTAVFVSTGCCFNAQQEIKTRLLEMSAVVVDQVSGTTSHIVADYYTSEEAMDQARAIGANVVVVDVQWVHECYDKKRRIPENEFPVLECRSLREKLKRVSSIIAEKSVDVEKHVEDPSFQNIISNSNRSSILQKSMNAQGLLDQIRMISNQLDALAKDYREQPRSNHPHLHCTDCPNHTIPNVDKTPSFVQKITNGSNKRAPRMRPMRNNVYHNLFKAQTAKEKSAILRRRSHGGFVLEHRDPEDSSISVVQANKDVREVLQPLRKKQARKAGATTATMNDMRKIVATDLNEIRETLKQNVDLTKKRVGPKLKKRKGMFGKRQGRAKAVPVVENLAVSNDVELESAMASLNLNQKRMRTSSQYGRPLFPTRSSFINRLQCVGSTDDFVSVDPLQSIKKTSIVLSGFDKRTAKNLRQTAEKLGLHVVSNVATDTKCVVSRAGERTLTVMNAVCRFVPIVHAAWLEESAVEDEVLSIRPYTFEDWKMLIEKRKENPWIFANLGCIWVADGCSPPSDQLRFMIRMTGGKVTSRIEKSTLIVVPANYPKVDFELRWRTSPPVVSASFIIDSITQNQLMMFTDYLEQTLDTLAETLQDDSTIDN